MMMMILLGQTLVCSVAYFIKFPYEYFSSLQYCLVG